MFREPTKRVVFVFEMVCYEDCASLAPIERVLAMARQEGILVSKKAVNPDNKDYESYEDLAFEQLPELDKLELKDPDWYLNID